MPAFALTAAEIAAAEAAAVAAAEAAAIQAAQVAAAEAAAQAAATAAAEQAAAQAATQAAAQQATTSGIQTLAQEVTGAQPAGIEQLTQAFQNVNPPPMSQAEFLNNSLAGANTPFNPVTNAGTPLSQLIPATPSIPPMAPPAVPVAPVSNPMTYFDATQPFANPAYASAPPAAPTSPVNPVLSSSYAAPNTDPTLGGVGTGYQGQAVQIGSATNATPYTPAELQTMQGPTQPGGIESLFNKGLEYVQKNPLQAAMGAMTAANYLTQKKPEEKEKYKSTFNRNTYQAYNPVQPTPYQPQYPNYAVGGLADLGGYSDGGRMLKGPGDGMSDDIPATIAGKQPARLANEEFVIPADVVSHLGNGSSEAGAKQLYKMMDRIRKARTGTKKQGKQINPEKYLA